MTGRAPSGQALVASDEAPTGLHPSGFDPSRWHGPRYSPNLNRWLAGVKRDRSHRGVPHVFRDPEGVRWIGWIDDCDMFIGTRLMRCLTVGRKAEVGAWMKIAESLTEEPDFWRHYDQIGRCHIDPRHNGWWVGEETRWLTDGETRSCLWCGNHTQHLRRWTDTVERERWEPAIATEARRAETENTGSVHEGAGPQDIAQ